jgi:metallo-beta-lactamase class B
MRGAVLMAMMGLLWLAGRANAGAIECSRCEEWNRDQAPFQVFGNAYYVGTRGLSAMLVTSANGHIILDGALPQSAPLIARHVQQLGFKMSDVKVILVTHTHYDHSGGVAELQKFSGAMVIASDLAAEPLRTGKVGRNDPQFEVISPSPPVSNVEALGARRSVKVGDLQLNVIHTPGHTPGGTSWTWQSCEGQRCLNIVYGDSLNAVSDDSFKYSGDARDPKAAANLTASMAAIDAAPCDILIVDHPERTGLWSIIDEQGKGDRSKFIDASACKRYAAESKQAFAKRLEREKQAP